VARKLELEQNTTTTAWYFFLDDIIGVDSLELFLDIRLDHMSKYVSYGRNEEISFLPEFLYILPATLRFIPKSSYNDKSLHHSQYISLTFFGIIIYFFFLLILTVKYYTILIMYFTVKYMFPYEVGCHYCNCFFYSHLHQDEVMQYSKGR